MRVFFSRLSMVKEISQIPLEALGLEESLHRSVLLAQCAPNKGKASLDSYFLFLRNHLVGENIPQWSLW